MRSKANWIPLSAALLAWVVGILAPAARADEPYASYIFPAGGQRGTSVTFRVGGHYLHEGCPFEMLGPGVVAANRLTPTDTLWFEGPLVPLPASQQKEDYPRDYAGSAQIAADAPLGHRYWRLWTSQGAVPSLKFVVGDLPEVIEQEVDGEPIPAPVTLPVTINGRIFPREDVDCWSFSAKAGEVIHAEVEALSIGSPLEARLEAIGPAGQPLAENGGAAGSDARLTFTAPADGAYCLRIHDMTFGGLQHYVYRLTLTAGPHVERVYPLGGQRGATVRLDLTGEGLPGAQADVVLPKEGEAFQRVPLSVAGQALSPVGLELGDLPEQLEAEPNDSAASAATVSGPAVLNGRIGQPGDLDHWNLTGKQGEIWEFDIRAARLGSPLDSMLVVLDAAGKELARADDLPNGQTDSQLFFTLPADGAYTLQVTDRFSSRGGVAFAYRLKVSRPAPDFRLSLATDAVTVYRGAQAKLKVNAERFGQFNGPIAIAVEGLPAGMTLTAAEIGANQAQVELTFTADKTARIQAASVQVRGTADVGGAKITRTATLPAASGQWAVESVLLAVAMPTPFKTVGRYDVTFVPRGTVYHRHYTIERNGFEGPLKVSMADRQTRHLQGVTGPTVDVPAGQNACDYPVFLAPWMELGRTSRSVVMVVGVVQDSDGSQHTVSFTSQNQNEQVVALVGPGLLTAHTEQPSLRATAGVAAELPVRIARHKSLVGPVTVELVLPAHMRGITAEKVTVAADQDVAQLRLEFAPGFGPLNMPVLIRATAIRNGEPVVAEARLDIVPSAEPGR